LASYGHKKTRGRQPRVPLGQHVRRRDDPRGMIGAVAALILQKPPRALVIWHDEMLTFEPLEALTEMLQQMPLP
jgi:hypothetical protein